MDEKFSAESMRSEAGPKPSLYTTRSFSSVVLISYLPFSRLPAPLLSRQAECFKIFVLAVIIDQLAIPSSDDSGIRISWHLPGTGAAPDDEME